MPIYLQIGPAKEGVNAHLRRVVVDEERAITGESKDPDHIGWIPVEAFEFDKPVNGSHTVKRDNVVPARLLFGVDFICTRVVDGTSLAIFKLAMGDDLEELAATIDLVFDETLRLSVYLSSVIVSSYSTSPRGGPNPIETFTLNWDRIDLDYGR
jgi:type VI protein secretion system component Hcp